MVDTLRNEAIRKAAYEKWEQAGRPEGRELEFWLAAERELPEGNSRRRIDAVQEASEESFVASDAPARTPANAVGPHGEHQTPPAPKKTRRGATPARR